LHRAPYIDADAGSKGADVLVSLDAFNQIYGKELPVHGNIQGRDSLLLFLLRETPRWNPGGRLQLLATKVRHPRARARQLPVHGVLAVSLLATTSSS
jgi:hypothetical protein